MAIDYSGMSNPSTGQNWSSSLAGGSGQKSWWQNLMGGVGNFLGSENFQNGLGLAGLIGQYKLGNDQNKLLGQQIGIQREQQDIYAANNQFEVDKNLYMLNQTTDGSIQYNS